MTVGANGIATGELIIVLSLESFKLLNPKISRFDRGTGGTPEITFQEVSDCLATMSLPAAAWARLCYAMQWNYREQVFAYLAACLIKDKSINGTKAPYWIGMLEMCIDSTLTETHLTNRTKSKALNLRWWTKNNEQHLQKCLYFLDQLDYEVRGAVTDWNKGRSVQDI